MTSKHINKHANWETHSIGSCSSKGKAIIQKNMRTTQCKFNETDNDVNTQFLYEK